MPTDRLGLLQPVVVVAGTYLLHSTILLTGAWLVITVGRVRSHALAERLWKMAALLGLVTAPVQLALGWSSPILDVTLGPSVTPASSTSCSEAKPKRLSPISMPARNGFGASWGWRARMAE